MLRSHQTKVDREMQPPIPLSILLFATFFIIGLSLVLSGLFVTASVGIGIRRRSIVAAVVFIVVILVVPKAASFVASALLLMSFERRRSISTTVSTAVSTTITTATFATAGILLVDDTSSHFVRTLSAFLCKDNF